MSTKLSAEHLYKELANAARELISTIDEVFEDAVLINGDAARLTAAIDKVEKLYWRGKMNEDFVCPDCGGDPVIAEIARRMGHRPDIAFAAVRRIEHDYATLAAAALELVEAAKLYTGILPHLKETSWLDDAKQFSAALAAVEQIIKK